MFRCSVGCLLGNGTWEGTAGESHSAASNPINSAEAPASLLLNLKQVDLTVLTTMKNNSCLTTPCRSLDWEHRRMHSGLWPTSAFCLPQRLPEATPFMIPARNWVAGFTCTHERMDSWREGVVFYVQHWGHSAPALPLGTVWNGLQCCRNEASWFHDKRKAQGPGSFFL